MEAALESPVCVRTEMAASVSRIAADAEMGVHPVGVPRAMKLLIVRR